MMAPPAPAQRRMPPKGMPLPSMPPGYKPPVRPGPPGRLGPPNTMPPRGMPPPSQADRDWDAPKRTPPLGSKMPARKKKQPAKWPAPPVARGRVTADRLSASY